MLQITEDTPPDMLAGAMDLTVHLPSGRAVKMSVERSMPMMDLLVQITAKHQLQLTNYVLQALEMAPSSEYGDKILPYKPNTPIGTLDTQHVKVVPKSRTIPVPKSTPTGHQPFESTFRLKVYLPRNQLYVTRVSKHVMLDDILKKICEEKNLNSTKYVFKHPGNLDEVLDPKLTLSDYQITEIYLVLKGTVNLSQTFSSSDVMALRKEEERKQMHNKTGGGVFNLIFRKGKSSMGSGSISSDTRSISPTHSDDSRSVTPPAVTLSVQAPPPPKREIPPERPKPPQRKRRPAPKPPASTSDIKKEKQEEKTPEVKDMRQEHTDGVRESESTRRSDNGLVICHSRNSSDSSGYHEASVLSENCHASLPRRPKSAFVMPGEVNKISKLHSQSTTNLANMSSHSKSTTSLGVTGRKKKAAPLPPPLIRASNPTINVDIPKPVVASQPPITSKESVTSHQNLDNLVSCPNPICDVKKEENPCFGSTDSGIAQETTEKLLDGDEAPSITPPPPPDFSEESSVLVANSIEKDTTKDVPITLITELSETTRISGSNERVTEYSNPIMSEAESTHFQEDADTGEIDWQYQLPSPPKAFRDSSPNTVSESSSMESTTNFKDSVVTSPELFEKLKRIEDHQSEIGTVKSDLTSVLSQEDGPLLNTLSLDTLEKRKSLVYNKELTTSLKMTDDRGETFSGLLTKFESTHNEIQDCRPKTSEPKFIQKTVITSNTLPNFKIQTYDHPKQKIKVFEDETVRSNTDIFKTPRTDRNSFSDSTLNVTQLGRSMENISIRKVSLDSHAETEYVFFKENTESKPFGYVANVTRSESFSHENLWSPSKPVSRSKSQLTLNIHNKRDKTTTTDENRSRSNSFYDVSGLQSLGVMRLIQNKLNTPTSSLENISQEEKRQPTCKIEYQKKIPKSIVEDETSPVVEKIYKYSGPPSINMGTWSERPKVPVSVKEDDDYKLGNVSSKLIVNTLNNNISSRNSIEIKQNNESKSRYDQQDSEINVKANQGFKFIDSRRFVNHNTGITYRKPFSNINNDQRPHSVAFASNFDISRVPVVRSVELKKSFKDKNTSVTQIYQDDSFIKSNRELVTNGFPKDATSEKQSKPVFRVNSFNPQRTPVVRGFSSTNKKLSWNSANCYNTLPNKTNDKDKYATNSHAPFSQAHLRRNYSTKLSNIQNEAVKVAETDTPSFHSLPAITRETKPDIKPPPPPLMPKVTLKKTVIKSVEPVLDQRDQLLSAIRNFGGKKGLKAVKV